MWICANVQARVIALILKFGSATKSELMYGEIVLKLNQDNTTQCEGVWSVPNNNQYGE